MDLNSLRLLMSSAGHGVLPPVDTWWMSLPDAPSAAYDHAFDSNNNYYSIFPATNYQSATLIKINSDATTIQQYTITSTNSDRVYDSIRCDSSGSIYLFGYQQAQQYVHVTKYDSSTMTKQWEKTVAATGYVGVVNRSVHVASTGIYILYVGTNSNGVQSLNLIKILSSGTVLFTRKLTNAGSSLECLESSSLCADSTGAAYFAFISSNSNPHFAKYSSTGTLNWQRSVSSTYGSTISGLACDSSGNTYAAIEAYNAGGTSAQVLLKSTTAGAVDWTRWNSNDCFTSSNACVTVDSVGDIYFTYQDELNSKLLFKINASGTKLYSRSPIGLWPSPVRISGSGHMALRGSNAGYVLKVPTDGSKADASYGGGDYLSNTLTLNTTNNGITTSASTENTSSTISPTVSNTTQTSVSGPTTITPSYGYVR